MATDNQNNVPINEEEDQKAATRDPEDTTLGYTHDTENKEAGEMEAVQHAYDASTPSYELDLDKGIADKEEE